jgi:hypothetical protein
LKKRRGAEGSANGYWFIRGTFLLPNRTKNFWGLKNESPNNATITVLHGRKTLAGQFETFDCDIAEIKKGATD